MTLNIKNRNECIIISQQTDKRKDLYDYRLICAIAKTESSQIKKQFYKIGI